MESDLNGPMDRILRYIKNTFFTLITGYDGTWFSNELYRNVNESHCKKSSEHLPWLHLATWSSIRPTIALSLSTHSQLDRTTGATCANWYLFNGTYLQDTAMRPLYLSCAAVLA